MNDRLSFLQHNKTVKTGLEIVALIWTILFGLFMLVMAIPILKNDLIRFADKSAFLLNNSDIGISVVFLHFFLLSLISVRCFFPSCLKTKFHTHYVFTGLLSTVLSLRIMGNFDGSQAHVAYYNSLNHIWYLLAFTGLTLHAGIWTGFWSSLRRETKNAYYGLVALSFAYASLTPNSEQQIFDPVLLLFSLSLSAPGVWWYFRFLLEKPHERWAVFGTFLFCLFAIFGTFIGEQYPDILQASLQTVLFNAAYIIYPLFCFYLLRSHRKTILLRPNLEIEQELRLKAAQLKKSNDALRIATEKRVLLEERERLTRDVHDGIGGKLLSLLVQVRSSDLKKQHIENELEDSLSDLRLIVDSLDTSEESFIVTLGTFHTRARTQLNATKIDLIWSQTDATLHHIPFDADTTLNINRFMQEVVTNCVRHSQADTMTITISRKPEQNEVLIMMEDNGIGIVDIDGARTHGRGLKNLQKRADLLRAKLSVESGNALKGVRFTLTVPTPAGT